MTVALDASAVLGHLAGEPGTEALDSILARAVEDGEGVVMSVVNLAEVRSMLARRWPEHVSELMIWVLGMGVQPVSADAVWEAAADIKARHAMSLADAFALATAKAHAAVLVARGDPELAIASKLGVKLLRI